MSKDRAVYDSYVQFCTGVVAPKSFEEWSLDRDDLAEREQGRTDFTSEHAALDVPQTLPALTERWSEGRLLKTQTKLFCREHQGLVAVVSSTRKEAVLACGHTRKLALDLTPGVE